MKNVKNLFKKKNINENIKKITNLNIDSRLTKNISETYDITIPTPIFDTPSENNRFKETYGEFAPKLKLTTFDNSFIKQLNLAGQYEFGSNSNGFSQDNYMIGLGADLNVPISGMKYASASLYHVINDNTDDDQQITLTYGWEKNNFVIDGYVDYSFNNDDLKDQLHINPQIKYNLQPILGIDNRLEVGLEYSYWKNKYGSDITQNAPSALVKFHF